MDSAPVFHPERSKYLVFTLDFVVPACLILTVLISAWLILYSKIFQVTRLSCTLDFRACDNPSLLAELDHLRGQNLFTLSTSALRARLTSGDFTIHQAEISRELPGTLHVVLTSVYPSVALQLEGGTDWVVLDTQYRVIASRSADPNVPTVVLTSPISLTLGKKPGDQVVLDTLTLARQLFDQLFSVKTITLRDNSTIELTLEGGKHALFTPTKDVMEQLRALQSILANATILKGVKTIDVRFNQPVLR